MAADEIVKAPSCNIQASSNPNNNAAAQAQAQEDAVTTNNVKTTNSSSSSSSKSKSKKQNYFDRQWEEEVTRATAMAQSALNYEQLELEQEQQQKYNVHFDTLQSWSGGSAFHQSSNSRKLMIPTMTPLNEHFFTVDDPNGSISINSGNQVIQNMLPIMGPGTSAALSEAARRMEREAASYTNPEVDVLQEESDLIVRMTRCIAQSLDNNNKDEHEYEQHNNMNNTARTSLNTCIEIGDDSKMNMNVGSKLRSTSLNNNHNNRLRPFNTDTATPVRAEHEAILNQLDVGDIINVESAFDTIRAVGQFAPRRVCQHPFRKNDIVWVCRTCQADETCVLCHACWSDR